MLKVKVKKNIPDFRKKNKKNKAGEKQPQQPEPTQTDGATINGEACKNSVEPEASKEVSASLSTNLGHDDLLKIKKAMEFLQVKVRLLKQRFKIKLNRRCPKQLSMGPAVGGA
jgi:hypothetical protein